MNAIISTADFMKDLNDLSPMVKVIQDATDALEKANIKAKLTAEKRDFEELDRLLGKYGIVNIVTHIGNYCYEQYESPPDDFDDDKRRQFCEDMLLANEVIACAAEAVDLPYGTNYAFHGEIRAKRVAAFRAKAAKVKA